MELNKTALNEWHKSHGEVISFAGWELPVRFSSVPDEHMAVREKVGLFDLSHMGRLLIEGWGSTPFLERLLTRDVAGLSSGRCGYSAVCNEKGGIKDDIVIDKFSKEEYFFICNAANRLKILEWLNSLRRFASGLLKDSTAGSPMKSPFNVKIDDKTSSTIFLAVQGPEAENTLQKITTGDLPESRYSFKMLEVSSFKSIVSRTGYTGEDGFEIIPLNIPNEPCEDALSLWNSILEAGEEYGITPCGLGSRDTLRLETGMPLYGNDLREDITPLEARLGFVVDLSEEKQFIGKDRLLEQEEEELEKIRVGFEMIDRGVPRHGKNIEREGKKIGEVTSGTFSPVLEKGIGMGYVPPEYSDSGTELNIVIRNKKTRAKIAEWPFHSERRKK